MKQNRVITGLDLTSEYPPQGDYKQTLETDLISPNSSRTSASQGGYPCFCGDSNVVSYQVQETPWGSIGSTLDRSHIDAVDPQIPGYIWKWIIGIDCSRASIGAVHGPGVSIAQHVFAALGQRAPVQDPAWQEFVLIMLRTFDGTQDPELLRNMYDVFGDGCVNSRSSVLQAMQTPERVRAREKLCREGRFTYLDNCGENSAAAQILQDEAIRHLVRCALCLVP